MSELTRDLLPMAASRVSIFEITLHYSTKSFNPKGFYALTKSTDSVMADVVDLSEDEIQRFQEGGIIVNNGVKITLEFELTKIPDKITFGLNTYVIIDDVIGEGTSVLTCSRKTAGTATEEAGS